VLDLVLPGRMRLRRLKLLGLDDELKPFIRSVRNPPFPVRPVAGFLSVAEGSDVEFGNGLREVQQDPLGSSFFTLADVVTFSIPEVSAGALCIPEQRCCEPCHDWARRGRSWSRHVYPIGRLWAAGQGLPASEDRMSGRERLEIYRSFCSTQKCTDLVGRRFASTM